MKKLYLLLSFVVCYSFAGNGQSAGLQIIHNAMGQGIEGPAVDIYLNGQLIEEHQGLTFRGATAFLEVPSGVPLVAGVALSPSSSASDTLTAFNLGALASGSENIAVFYGIVGDAGSPLQVALNTAGRAAGSAPGLLDLVAFHGSPAVSAVDIQSFLGEETLFQGIKYGDFSTYQSVDPTDYFLEVAPSGEEELIGTFQNDFSGRGQQAAVIFTSGMPNAEPLFNLFAAFPDGQVVELLPVALVQIIHNSPAPELAVTDLWVVDLEVPIVNDLEFLEATPVAFFPTRLVFDLGFAPANSTGVEDVQFTIENVSFADGRQYTVIAGGLPGSELFPFQLFINDKARLRSPDENQVAVSVFHGIPGLGTVDLRLRDGDLLATDLAFGQFSALSLQAAQPAVWTLLDAAGGASLASFAGDLQGEEGLGATLFAGGLPQNGLQPGLYFALADGRVLALDPVTRVQIIHNSPAEAFDVYVDGEKIVNDLVFRKATAYLDLATRQEQEVTLANWSTGAPVITFDPLTLEDGKEYLLMIAGVDGSVDQPLSLFVFDVARLIAEGGQGTDLLFFHGSPDAPSADLTLGEAMPLFQDVARGEFAGYNNVPAISQTLTVTAAGDSQVVLGEYSLDLREIDGKTAVLYATGYVEEGQVAPFELWIAFADGTARPLSKPTSAKNLEKLIGGFTVWPNPARGAANLEFRLEEAMDLQLQLFDQQGQSVRHYQVGRLTVGDHRWRLDVGGLPGGLYLLGIQTPKGTLSTKVVVH